MEFTLPIAVPVNHLSEEILTPGLMKVEELSPHPDLLVLPEYAPKCTSWLLNGMLLMGLKAYFPSCFPPCLFEHLFEQPSQSCTGWHPVGFLPQDGSLA
ncbi:hypothetical protein DSO57_1030014 [Entomophthora muscae]|uniref:Uncharacterized protein n=1 Tax=Entomophthora muscae TaxID=34485 RepID=A0ACC2TN86_9FUNG|nr:hypothetical protein DSO57_1030014 [Entomophthora muscae]